MPRSAIHVVVQAVCHARQEQGVAKLVGVRPLMRSAVRGDIIVKQEGFVVETLDALQLEPRVVLTGAFVRLGPAASFTKESLAVVPMEYVRTSSIDFTISLENSASKTSAISTSTPTADSSNSSSTPTPKPPKPTTASNEPAQTSTPNCADFLDGTTTSTSQDIGLCVVTSQSTSPLLSTFSATALRVPTDLPTFTSKATANDLGMVLGIFIFTLYAAVVVLL